MKRIAIITAVITAFAVAPSVATAGGGGKSQRPQISPKSTPKVVPGTQVWQAGNHRMY